MSKGKKRAILIIAGVVLLIVAVFSGFQIHMATSWSFETRTVEGRTVYEYRKPGNQASVALSPDNTHKLLFSNYGKSIFDMMPRDYLVDISDIEKLVCSPRDFTKATTLTALCRNFLRLAIRLSGRIIHTPTQGYKRFYVTM